MVPLLLKLKPAEYNTYVEPFAGSRDRAERTEVVWRKVHTNAQGSLF